MSWLLKALDRIRHPSTSWSWASAGTSEQAAVDMAREVGNGLGSSVIMAPVQWLQRTVPTAPLVVEADGKPLPNHPLAALLHNPNPAYSRDHLLSATVLSLCVAGNAYWLKVRNGSGRVVELWYAPHWLIRPRWPVDGSEYISHYEYRPGTEVQTLLPSDVVHIRAGINPDDLRMGLAPLASALREVWSDMEASVFAAAILRNAGIPGLILSPDGPQSASPDDLAAMKRYLSEQFSGAKRGTPLVFSAKTKIDRLAWNPKELDLTSITDRAEERVCALLGVPPVVVGLHAGTSQTSVGATMREQVRIAWHSGVIPMQNNIASEVLRSLAPDFPQPARLRLYFDTAQIEALREDADAVSGRADKLLRAGIITLAESRQMLGIPVNRSHDIFLRPMGVIETPAATKAAQATGTKCHHQSAHVKHSHSPIDVRIAEHAPHTEPTEAEETFADSLEALRRRSSARWARALGTYFRELGEAAATAAEPAIEAEEKSALLNGMLTDRVIEAMQMPEHRRLFVGLYEREYLRCAEDVRSAAARAGLPQLATSISDPVARAIIATGGRRAGLVDIGAQTRDAILSAVAHGRAEGLGAAAIARQIRDAVPAGPWSSPKIRAEVIARTEAKYAQNYSTVEHGRANGILHYIIFDARLGDTDEICMALDGAIVSADEAYELMLTEHPNGTRSFAPHYLD